MTSLRSFLTRGAVAGTAVMILLVYLVIFRAYAGFVGRDAERRAEGAAEAIFSTIYQQMGKGWTKEDLEQYFAANRTSWSRARLEVLAHYRAAQDGGAASTEPEVGEVFRTGEAKTLRQGTLVRFLYPKKAEPACLVCHASASAGEVLGVLEVREDLAPLLEEAKRRTAAYLVGLAPLPLGGAWLVAVLLGRRLRRCTERLRQKVEAVNRVEDLKALEMESTDFLFSEFNFLYAELRGLTGRLRQIAVDKEILEFQVRLLEKLVITSEVVKEWQEYVKGLLLQINTVVPAPLIFSVFRLNGAEHDVQVFWLRPPALQARAALEEIILNKLRSSSIFAASLPEEALSFNHHVADKNSPPIEIDAASLEVHTKALILDAPSIGGIVGIGVNSALAASPTGALVLESVLTTLLNVIGSVKAIYKYTKDLEYYATRDPLTGLYSQRVFWELLEYEVERARRHNYQFAVLVVDLDNFKTINDLYGHLVGDEVLRAAARMFRTGLRREDVVARYGGDEFAAILPMAGQAQAFMAARRVQERLKDFSYITPAGKPVRVSASIGIAVFPDHGGDARTLFTVADNMLYRAKQAGKNAVWLPTIEDVAEVLRSLADKRAIISDALAEGRIVPYFQPIVSLATGQIEGHEVLMRITLPERTLAAAEFVETATEMGLIDRLDLAVAEKALAEARRTDYRGLLFLNVSPKTLVKRDFLPALCRLIEHYGFDPARLVFELTERETVADFDVLKAIVFQLKQHGFGLAVDDFGSGFSSFWYIRQLPVDFLKIDGEFVRHLADGDAADLAIVGCMAGLGERLGIKTIAEHVESEAVRQAVAGLGVNYAQGYYTGRPSPSLAPAP